MWMAESKRKTSAKSRKVEALKRQIKEKLKKAECYDPEMDYQIEIAATDILVYRKLREEAINGVDDIVITEKSREGNDRSRVNPIYETLQKQADVVRKDLRALYMNREIARKGKKNDSSDPMMEFMRSVTEDK